MRKYDLIVDGLDFDDFYCQQDIEKIMRNKPMREDNSINLNILVKNPGEINFGDEIDIMFDTENDPRWSWSESESLEDGSTAYLFVYDFEPTLDLEDDYIQREALKACGYSLDQIRIHLNAKHNYVPEHYTFLDAAGWLEWYIDDLGVKYDESDPDEIDGISREEFINNELVYDFYTADRDEIVERIKSGDIHADQLEGSWCEIFNTKVWVKEW